MSIGQSFMNALVLGVVSVTAAFVIAACMGQMVKRSKTRPKAKRRIAFYSPYREATRARRYQRKLNRLTRRIERKVKRKAKWNTEGVNY